MQTHHSWNTQQWATVIRQFSNSCREREQCLHKTVFQFQLVRSSLYNYKELENMKTFYYRAMKSIQNLRYNIIAVPIPFWISLSHHINANEKCRRELSTDTSCSLVLLAYAMSIFRRFEFFYLRVFYEELHNLYRSPNIVRVIKSRRLRWAGHVARMEEGRSAFKILTGKPTGKRPLGRPRCRW